MAATESWPGVTGLPSSGALFPIPSGDVLAKANLTSLLHPGRKSLWLLERLEIGKVTQRPNFKSESYLNQLADC